MVKDVAASLTVAALLVSQSGGLQQIDVCPPFTNQQRNSIESDPELRLWVVLHGGVGRLMNGVLCRPWSPLVAVVN